MSNQKTNSVLVFVAVLVAAIIVIYAITSRKPATTPPTDGLIPAGATDDIADAEDPGLGANPDEGVTLIDQTTDTTRGEVPGGADSPDAAAEPTDDDTGSQDQAIALPTTLVEAATAGDVAVLQAMIDSGMDINATDDGGRTPLMLAAGAGHLDAVFALLNAGADPALRDNARRAARDYALARVDQAGQTIARILEDAVGPIPVQDASDK
ncbi:MAG: ankyrin repeat domain-containing protein [Planctomycetota bacterium]|nr:ankyrin repeat domain-containing protein [Planctomycetota bacterium]